MSTVIPHEPLAGARQRWFILALALVFVAVGVQFTHKAIQRKTALIRWMPQIEEMDNGSKIYDHFNYPNPPIMALLLSPLVAIPNPIVGAFVWFFLKIGMTLLALGWVFRLIESEEVRFPTWAKGVTVLLSLRPVMSDLIHGNVNLFILFLVIAAVFAYQRGRPFVSGVVVALAIACKVTPALFIPYFLWKRQWKALAGCAVGLGLFLFVVPSAFFGWQDNNEKLLAWTKQMILPFVAKGEVTSEHNNQSVPGLAHRLLTHAPSSSTYVNDQKVATEYHNVVSLDPRTAGLIVKGCMALFALLVVWSCRTPSTIRPGWRSAAEFSIVVLGMLLFSERTWKHHAVTLLLPFAVLCYYLAACRPTGWVRNAVVASLGTAALLMAATSTGLLGSRLGELGQVYGAFVWAYVVLLGALVLILRTPDQPPEVAIP
jgi:alpha-1,2-mannosyltransferase